MEPLDAHAVETFLRALGTHQDEPAELELLGGCALILLGNKRTTMDIDYVGDDLTQTAFQRTIDRVATALNVHVDAVQIGSFVPVPPDAVSRRVFIARHGSVDVFVIDPYLIALSKLDRGLETDIADIAFLVDAGQINLSRLSDLVTAAEPSAAAYHLDPVGMRRHLAEVRHEIRDR